MKVISILFSCCVFVACASDAVVEPAPGGQGGTNGGMNGGNNQGGCVDRDNDGYQAAYCNPSANGVPRGGDCDDYSNARSPGNREDCSNTLDNDCDGLVGARDPDCAKECEDADGDGVGDVTDDADHDGVWNPNDQCNDTPLNSKVNINGCRIFYLPPTNFRIKTSERCIGQNSIQLAVEDSSLQYNIAVSGSVNASASFSGDQWSLGELNAGQYTLCVTVDGVDPTEFERCFTVGIDEPQPLSVYGSLSTSGKSVRYSLKGGDVYTVTHNGKSFQTADNSFDIALEEGINTVQITTGIDCQGVFEQEYFNSSEVSFTPNPFQDYLNVFVGGNDSEVTLEIFTSQGRLIEQSIHQLQHKRMVKIPTAHLQPGSYIVKTCGQTTLQSTLIVKK